MDYPVYAKKVKNAVLRHRQRGVLICGSGIGMSMAANKVKGIRGQPMLGTAVRRAFETAQQCNVLCMGARILNRMAEDSVRLDCNGIFWNRNAIRGD